MTNRTRPLLLVDVDGVISLFGFDPARAPAGCFLMVDGTAHFLSATAGDHLRELAHDFELVWCTGWEERANDYLPHALGLPGELPLIPFDAFERPPDAHWKLAAIDAWVGPDRPLAWIDDAHDHRCHTWAGERAAPTLLIGTDPAVGLTAADVAQLRTWCSEIRERAVAPGA